MDTITVPIRFSRPGRWMRLVGISPARSWVKVDGDRLEARMWPYFSMQATRGAVRSVERVPGRVLSMGVHGWRGRWLVNGAGTGIVAVRFDPPGRGRLFGIPLKVRELAVSVDDDTLVEVLGPAPSPEVSR